MLKKLVNSLFGKKSISIVPIGNKIQINGLLIPEPTRSMLYVTSDSLENIKSPLSFNIQISLNEEGDVSVDANDGKGSLEAEPSMIWVRLLVKKNSALETNKMYYPSYSGLTPVQRYQYLAWLRDITQETNLSYVFLYFYGLERQLLFGDFDTAVEEAVRLLKNHRKGSFVNYAVGSLVSAAIARKRPDVVKMAPMLLKETTNEAIVLRVLAKGNITADDALGLRARIGYPKKYAEKYKKCFKAELSKIIKKYEFDKGSFFSQFNINTFPTKDTIAFANYSFPSEVRTIKVPQILNDDLFKTLIRDFMKEAYQLCKEKNKKTK